MSDSSKKPTTRSSIRQSLNLASVGKVFADAIGKEAKKTARRSSVLPSAHRPSMPEVRPPSKRTSTPESKTLTRRRVSASYARSSSDEQPSKPSDATSPNSVVPTKPSTLRPKNLNAASALPKYRPKSTLVEPAKPPSPVRAGTRRRFSTSDDEKKEQKRPGSGAPAEKTSRPISPLPQRAALKANLTNSLNRTPPTTPSKPKLTTPVKTSSPSRPSKIVKTNASTSVPRPSSSSSSLSLPQPNVTPKTSTPKGTALKAKLGLSRSAQSKSKSGTSTPNDSPSRNSPSPLTARHSRNPSKLTTPSASSVSGNMSHISECTSEAEDSDAEDVALLLAPVAAIGAPTPAMPRIQAKKRTAAPQTPSRTGLPTRDKMSYLSPLPPSSSEKSSPFLRPPPHGSANERAMRGSILSWEQLANETSVTLGEDEFGRMLSEIPAPFKSTPASPTLSSQLDIPESPLLTAMDSPGGYGSISQVLLPDVTPSPSMHQHLQQSKFALTPDAGAVDSSTATMLRLQLASAENTSKERLYQIQAMEEELYHLKQAHAHQMEEAQKQIAYMESQSRMNDDDDDASSVVFLEEQLRQAHISREQAVAETIARCQEEARVAHKVESLKSETWFFASVASSSWGMVHDACEVELDLVRGDKAVLSVLLAQLDQMAAVL